jgi:hypothetical protein
VVFYCADSPYLLPFVCNPYNGRKFLNDEQESFQENSILGKRDIGEVSLVMRLFSKIEGQKLLIKIDPCSAIK